MDAVLASTAARQHGLVTTTQLKAAGLGSSGISARVRRKALVRVHVGVYAIGHGALSREARFMAAVLAAGPRAALSHESAAELLRIARTRAPEIEVVVPARRTVAGVRVHRSPRLGPRDITRVNGIPVTHVARVLVDLTDRKIPEELTALIHEAAFRNALDLEAIELAMDRARGLRSLWALDEALRLYELGSAGTKSRGEVAAVRAIRAAGLPVPLVNVNRLGFESDLTWPRQRLIVEIDGPAHRRPPTRGHDARRDAATAEAGWTVIRIGSDEALHHPDRLLARIRELLR